MTTPRIIVTFRPGENGEPDSWYLARPPDDESPAPRPLTEADVRHIVRCVEEHDGLERVLVAAGALREAQRLYTASPDNEATARAVGAATFTLDEALSAIRTTRQPV